MKNRVIDIDKIKTFLPHRYPFLFVDKILEVGDTGVKGVKNVTVNEEFFNGHFPDYPVMPGVLILEALAQVAGVFVFLRYENDKSFDIKNKRPFFASIDNVRFKRPVRPGDCLILEASYVRTKLGFLMFDCKASVDDEIACTASLSALFK